VSEMIGDLFFGPHWLQQHRFCSYNGTLSQIVDRKSTKKITNNMRELHVLYKNLSQIWLELNLWICWGFFQNV